MTESRVNRLNKKLEQLYTQQCKLDLQEAEMRAVIEGKIDELAQKSVDLKSTKNLSNKSSRMGGTRGIGKSVDISHSNKNT